MGDLVLKPDRKLPRKPDDMASKLSSKFVGPYKIKRRLSSVVFSLVSIDGINVGKGHIRRLKPCVNENEQGPDSKIIKLDSCLSKLSK